MDDDEDYEPNGSASTSKGLDPKFPSPRGQRRGEFQCKICFRSFKYVKALNKHIKQHRQQQKLQKPQKAPAPALSYYKRKKMMEAAGITKTTPNAAASATSSRFKKEPQAEYDTVSPYSSPAPYQQRDLSPDFGALMLSTSQMIGDEEDEQHEIPKTSRTGRIIKRPNPDDAEYKPNGGQKRTRPSIPPKKTPVSTPVAAPPKKSVPVAKKVEEPPKRAVPATKTRGKSTPTRKKSEDTEEGFTIEGFSEVDITKMLKKSKKRDKMFELSKLLKNLLNISIIFFIF